MNNQDHIQSGGVLSGIFNMVWKKYNMLSVKSDKYCWENYINNDDSFFSKKTIAVSTVGLYNYINIWKSLIWGETSDIRGICTLKQYEKGIEDEENQEAVAGSYLLCIGADAL